MGDVCNRLDYCMYFRKVITTAGDCPSFTTELYQVPLYEPGLGIHTESDPIRHRL